MWNPFQKRSSLIEQQQIMLSNGITNAQILQDLRNDLSPESVMSHPMIRGGVQLIANLASTLPLNVYIDGGIAGRSVDHHHKWNYRLNHSPCGTSTRSIFIQTLLREAIVHGNSYHLILDDRLLWLDPTMTMPKTNGMDVIYETSINGVIKRFDQSQVLHIKNLSNNGGLSGQPLHEALPDALCAALQKYKHINKYFKEGTFSNLVWNLPEWVKGKEKRDEFIKVAEEKYGGYNNAYKNIYMNDGGSVEPLSASNTTSQTRELLEFDIIVCANILSLPADAIGANQNTSYNAQGIADLKYLRNVNHWLIQIEEQFTDKLMSTEDLHTGKRWIEFNRKASEEMNQPTLEALLKSQYESGAISLQYMRRKQNLPINDIAGERYIYDQPEPAAPQDQAEPEAEQPAEPQQPPQEPQKPSQAKRDNQLATMVRTSVDRLVKRIGKSNKPAMDHRDIWLSEFSDFENAEEVLRSIGKLIDGSTDSRETIAANINTEELANQLLEEK